MLSVSHSSFCDHHSAPTTALKTNCPSFAHVAVNLVFPTRILALLAAWDSWSIYPPLYITGLEAAFMRKSGDLESKDLSGVEESSLDKDALALKATQVRVEGCEAQYLVPARSNFFSVAGRLL